MEVWKPIPGFKAEASSEGRIKSFYQSIQGKIRKPQKGLRGKYLRIQFEHKGPILSVHRLVALAWHDNPFNLPVVAHKDDNGHNNRPDNLKWSTQKDNIAEQVRGAVKRYSAVEKQIMKDAFNAGFSKLSIGKYFGITDTSVRRIVNA